MTTFLTNLQKQEGGRLEESAKRWRIWHGPHFLNNGMQLQIEPWTWEFGMVYDPTSYRVRVRLAGCCCTIGTSLTSSIFAGIAYPLSIAPYFQNENYINLRLFLACHNPANIPCFINLTDELLGKIVRLHRRMDASQ